MYKKILLLSALLSVVVWMGPAKADNAFEGFASENALNPNCLATQLPRTTVYACADSSAEWNSDALPCTTSNGLQSIDYISPDFQCVKGAQNKGSIYTHIVDWRVDDCPSGTKCARLADCEKLGGDCVRNPGSDQSCVRFHCPAQNNTICCFDTKVVTPNDSMYPNMTFANIPLGKQRVGIGERIAFGSPQGYSSLGVNAGNESFRLKCGASYRIISYLYTPNNTNFKFYDDSAGSALPGSSIQTTKPASGSAVAMGNANFTYTPSKDMNISLKPTSGSGDAAQLLAPSHVVVQELTPPPTGSSGCGAQAETGNPDTGAKPDSNPKCAGFQYDMTSGSTVIPLKKDLEYTITPKLITNMPDGFSLVGEGENLPLQNNTAFDFTPTSDVDLSLRVPEGAWLDAPACIEVKENPIQPPVDPATIIEDDNPDDPCSSPEATWNIDTVLNRVFTDRFRCRWVDDAPCDEADLANCSPDRRLYTMIVASNVDCTCAGEGAPGQHCRCVRQTDCEANGGVCLSLKNNAARIDELTASGYIQVYFRCPFSDDVTCYMPGREQVTPTAEAEPVLPTVKTVKPRPALTLTLDGCCKQIVPVVEEGQEYQLNHFVQLAINIYECILCIIGSLMLLMIVVGGFYMLTSAGDPGKVKTGQGYIKAAVIGGIIVFSSYLVINFAITAFGATIVDTSKVQISPGK